MLPRFTTTEPYSLLSTMAGEEPPRPKEVPDRSKIKLPSDCHYNLYIHGKAERELGFDIPVLLEGELKDKDGQYECIVGGKSGYVIIWEKGVVNRRTSEGSIKLRNFRGLIVYADDSRSVGYGLKCLQDKPAIV